MARKYYGHEEFIAGDISIECASQRTNYGFRHVVTVYDGLYSYDGKACYYNRTWEKYTYQSAIKNTLAKADFTPGRIEKIMAKVEKQAIGAVNRELGVIRGIAKIGELFCSDQKGANDWKARMLKAGLGGRGLSMPDDWDNLSEDEKQRRLDGAIGALSPIN